MVSKVEKRYSLALYEAAEKSGMIGKVALDCQGLLNLIDNNEELRLFFKSPIIRSDTKINILKTLFSDKISQLTYNFLVFLVKKGREGITAGVLGSFLDRKDTSEGLLKPVFITAVELGDDIKTDIKSKLDEYTNLNCVPEYIIDKKLIGGFTVQINDTILDGSVKRQLEMLKIKFKSKL
ncbi:MAG: ATP synthase F1 subunit delta [Ignavibacteriae bacterium]|nr:ATP synthase F1 subunit delta [Ignavibacteriota bacterium]